VGDIDMAAPSEISAATEGTGIARGNVVAPLSAIARSANAACRIGPRAYVASVGRGTLRRCCPR